MSEAMQHEVIELADMRTVGVPHRGPYMQIRSAFEKLGEAAGRAGLFGRPGVVMLGVYYDDPRTTPADELRSSAALQLPDDVPTPDGLTEARIAGGRFLKVVHKGSYEALPETWEAAYGILSQERLQMRDAPSFEIYRTSPGEVAEADLLTEILIPIE